MEIPIEIKSVLLKDEEIDFCVHSKLFQKRSTSLSQIFGGLISKLIESFKDIGLVSTKILLLLYKAILLLLIVVVNFLFKVKERILKSITLNIFKG